MGTLQPAKFSCLLCVLLFPVVTQAQFTFTTNTDGTLNIYSYTGPGGAVTIPGTTNGLQVTSIGASAFASSGVTSVTIPNSVSSIGYDVFDSCLSLTNITIPSSITNIGDDAFYYCTNLTSLTIPNSLTSIGYDVFDSCFGLTNVTIPGSVTNIGGYAFNYCTGLRYVTIPNSVTAIGADAFYYCTNLLNVAIPNGLTSIGGWVFAVCSSLTNVTIPNSVTNIETRAFSGCASLTAITIPDSVLSIGDGGFASCGLTNIIIPASVTHIGNFEFGWCTNLSAISVDSNNLFYSSVDGVLFDKSQKTLIECPAGMAGSYAISNTVTSVGDFAFIGCVSLAGVLIPDSVTNLSQGAFQDCHSLASIIIPGSITSINDNTFMGCFSLTNVTIPDSITHLGSDVFYYRTSLTSLTIPSGITQFPDRSFEDCINLKSVYFEGDAPSVTSSFPYIFYGDNNVTVYYLPGTTGWGSTFSYRPATLWFLPNPLILTSEPNFGVHTNKFSFVISWATNASVVVEASTNLSSNVWQPIQTNTLTGGWVYFRDSDWTNYQSRLYRVSSQ